MKKLICLLLALLVLSSCAACAEGKLEITQKELFIDPDGNNNSFFAELTNTGDETVYINDGKLKLMDSKGETLKESSVSIAGVNPALKPGESFYVSEYIFEKLNDLEISSFDCTFRTGNWGTEYTRKPCDEVTYELSSDEGMENKVFVTVTNDSEDTIYRFYVVAALTSTEGELMFVDKTLSLNIGINPHNTVTVWVPVSSSLVKYWWDNNVEVGAVHGELIYK